MKLIKKHLAGIIAAILLIAIAVLCFFAFAPKDDIVTDANDTSLVTPLPPSGGNTDATKPTPVPVYESNIPKSALPSDKYLYTQTVCGNGNTVLCAVLQTATASYIIAETDCKSGDIASDKQTVGIVKIDSVGNIEKTYSLKANGEYVYVASCVTNSGIAIVTADKAKSYLYVTVTDYVLENTETKIMPYASNVALYPTEDTFLIFTDSGSENFIIKYTAEALVFSAVNSGETVAVFEFYDFYRVFYNTKSGYGMADIDKTDFSVNKTIFVSSATLYAIIPMVENGKQTYMAVENDNSVYIRKYYSDMAVKNSERKKIGNVEVLGYGNDENNIYLCVSGSIGGIITLKSDLSFSYTLNKTEAATSEILDYAYSGGFLLLVNDANKKTALISINKDSEEITYFDNCEKAMFMLYANGTAAIVYDSLFYDYSAIKIIGINR